MSDKKPFVVIDGSSYLYRAFHALPPLTNSKGVPTGAAYGVINMLRTLLNQYQPVHIAMVFDAKGKTFRDDLYPEYKAHRPPMPTDLQCQIQPLHDIIRAMGIPLLIVDGVEADDVIGTLAVHATQHGLQTLISTGDKDMAQLVNDHVTLVNTMTNTTMDIAGVKEKFGVGPERIIDYLTLIGDSVDNVPGVAKVGPKTAVKWLEEYGTLDNIMANADKFTGKIGENLRESLPQLPLSKQLVTIKCDVDLTFAPEDLTIKPSDDDALIALFRELEFKKWLTERLENHPQQNTPIATQYETILTQEQFQSWLKKLTESKLFAFDTETTSLDYMKAELVGMSFAVEPHHAAYLPLAHDALGTPEQLNREEVLLAMKPLLESTAHKKVGHNLKYDQHILANHGVHLQGIAFDTMLESATLASGGRNDLDGLALKYLGHRMISFEDVAGKGSKQLTFNQVALEEATPYAAEDADMTLQLHHMLWPKIEADAPLKKVFCDIEMPLLPVIAEMEQTGVLIDADLLRAQSKDLAQRIATLEQQAHEVAGRAFNIASPLQLQEILYQHMKLPVLETTPKGQPSTAESVLQELALNYPLPKIILEYRSLAKLKSTYTDKLPEQVDPRTGRVHTSYHQAGAATGRLSSSDPNLQNIPVRTDEGRKIRRAFIAPPGYQLVSADYSQVELRIMAHLSGDKNLIAAFHNKYDIHSATAAEVFNIPLDQVTPLHRRSAKAINFGLIYGMSAYGLARQLDIDRKSAQEYVDLYFTRYPGVKHYMDDIRQKARSQGYVETLMGRRLYLPEIHSSNKMRQNAAERAAINAPMQGTAADLIKLAMINIQRWLEEEKVQARMIMQVHDELVFEVEDSVVKDVCKGIEKRMDSAMKLSVPIEVSIGAGENWDAAH
jgi:DNA polymerase-1